ncbi:MAG TPA: sodium:solute symporter, partial [Saprospirales bacterium]|nr:sodium:solute symporter [Saprospirales bacterium]
KTLGESQKNIFTFSFILIFANILFLSLGALLYIYASKEGIEFTEVRDQIYPTIALNHLPSIIGIVFILGLIAAAYSSADSALTALTTTFCLDFLDFGKKERSESLKRKTRLIVHVGFSLVLLVTILLAKQLEETSIINQLFTFAGYTYGPILGLFTFGILTKRLIKDNLVIPICITAPIISYFINTNSVAWLGGFTFGHTIIALNGFITLIGLWFIS